MNPFPVRSPESFGKSLSSPVRLAALIGLALSLGIPASSSARDKTAPSDGWPPITDEERKLTSIPQDPDADAVLLVNDREGTPVKPTEQWFNQLHFHWRLKVLKPEGKRFGEIHIEAQRYSRVSNIEARTIKPDGTVVPVTPDQIFDKTVFQAGSYKHTEKAFNFPAVEPGAILEYRYVRTDNDLYFIDPWYFEGQLFTRSSHVTQVVPYGSGYMVLCDLCEGAKQDVSEWREGKEKGQIYSVTMHDLPGYHREIMMPPRREVSPRLDFILQNWKDVYFDPLGRGDRLFIDWTSVGNYALYHYEQAIKDGQAAIKPVAEGWIQGITDPQEKIRAIFQHVQQDFDYLPWTTVYGESSPIATILKNKTADNEEKAVLLLAALRAIGTQGFPALVSGRNGGALNPKFLSLTQFTHTIVVVPDPNGTPQYLDPTVAYAPFGFVPWKDSEADILAIKKKDSAEIGKLPLKNELSTTKYSITLKPRPDAKADLEIEARFTGEDAIDLRDDLVPASESGRADYIKEWLGEARPGAVLVSQSIENLDKLDEPLVLKIKAEAEGLVTVAEGVQVIRGCVLGCFQSNPISRAARQHPFYVDRGWNLSQEVLIVPPGGMKAGSMPVGAAARSTIGSLTMSCVSRDEEGVACRRQFTARRNRWDASERDGIRAMYDKIVQADGMAVSFEAVAGGN
jgi:hypothetical protein